MKRFEKFFLLAAWAVFFATGRRLVGSLFLMLAGAYALIGIVSRIQGDE